MFMFHSCALVIATVIQNRDKVIPPMFSLCYCLWAFTVEAMIIREEKGALSARDTRTLLSISPLIFLLHHLDNFLPPLLPRNLITLTNLLKYSINEHVTN